MTKLISRRELIQHLGLAALGAPFASELARGRTPVAASIRFGYAAITWEGKDEQAIDDIASLGFRGIQLRANMVAKYGERPAALRDMLDKRGLTFVALSSGNLDIDPAVERDQLALHLHHATFLRDAGGHYLQIIDQRPRGRTVTSTDFARLGKLLSELGKRTADIGITVGYHPHMGSIGEDPSAIRKILKEADPRYVKLALDTAHYQQGGGDPSRAVKDYSDRLLFLHIKDLESPVPGNPDQRSYRFVELGRGRVDLKRVFDALDQAAFTGWAIVELDRVPDASRSPREAALTSKRYIEDVLKRSVER